MTKQENALAVVLRNYQQFRSDFAEWLIENFHVFEAFEREADRIRAKGRAHWSHRTIWEYLRHETALREKDSDLKLDNNYTRSCAVLYSLLHPDAKGFFSFRDGVSVAEQARAA